MLPAYSYLASATQESALPNTRHIATFTRTWCQPSSSYYNQPDVFKHPLYM